jgi:hypothetical protein
MPSLAMTTELDAMEHLLIKYFIPKDRCEGRMVQYIIIIYPTEFNKFSLQEI